jgi:hypothetical protein
LSMVQGGPIPNDVAYLPGATQRMLAEAISRGTAQQQSAMAVLQDTLGRLGLLGLARWAWLQQVNGASPAQVDITMRLQPLFKQMFPEIEARQRAGLPPVSPGWIVSYRDNVKQMEHLAGFPSGFLTSYTQRWIETDVSATEARTRVVDGLVAAQQAPQATRDQLRSMYGLGDGALAAFFLDERNALPMIQREFAAAQISGTGVQSGYGGLSAREAEGLVAQGVSTNQAQQGLGQLALERQLFQALPGQENSQENIGRDLQLGSAFGNSQDRRRVRRAVLGRTAQFNQGEAFQAAQGGVVGLGSVTGS